MSSAHAYRVNGDIVPDQAFYAVACHPARHVVVEACAGAGKTWMLVSRILRALLEGAEPQQILAITFTKKAAAEMRQRLNEWLADFAGKTPEQLVPELVMRGMTPEQAQQQAPALQGLYLRLLQHGRSPQIRTFHSWFAALLRAAPLQVLEQQGLPSQYELLQDDARAVAEVWRPFFQELLRDDSARADFDALVQLHGRSNTLKALEAALAKRVEFQLAQQHGVLEQSVLPFQTLVPELKEHASPAASLEGEAAAQRWHARSAALGTEKNKTPQQAAAQVVEAFEQQDPELRLQQLRKAFFVKDEDRLTKNLQKYDVAQEAEAELQLLCRAQAQHAAWLYQQRMVRLTLMLLACYAQVKREHGWIDMADIEVSAGQLLGDELLSGWIQERLDAQVRHLLIDEFQDTNPIQWHALEGWLSGYAGAATPPSVFIVGDPKQSIYRFRRADPEVFREARRFVQQALGGAVLECDHTRRNAQPVIDAVNALMQAAQDEGRYADFRTHTTAATVAGCVLTLPPIARAPKAEADAASGWRDSLTTPQLEEEEALMARECRQTAQWLQRCVQAGTPVGDILVIARKNARVAAMQHALAEAGLPALKADKLLLAEAPEVQDVVALVDALLSPRHDLSLARALKSPIVGLDDAQLVEIRLGVQQAAQQTEPLAISWLDWLLAHADADPALSPWQPLARRLLRWQQWLQQRLPHDALDAIFRDGDLLARYAASTPPALCAGVLERLQALPGHMLALDGGRFVSAYRWVRAMRGGDPTGTPAVGGQGVRLLTVHGSKGLEAGLVLLLDTDAAKGRSKSMDVLVDWPGSQSHPTQLVFLQSFSNPPPSVQPLVQQELQAEEREESNALYVAMTRARQVLAFSSTEPRSTQEHGWWQQWLQHADALALQPDDAGQLPVPDDWPAIRHKPDAQEAAPVRAGQVLELPALAAELQRHVQLTIADLAARDADRALQATLGEAMHKVLEWHRHGAMQQDPEQQRQSLQQRYQLDAAQAARVLAQAQGILQGDAAWAWDEQQVDWQANEIDLAWNRQVLRIDRLVHRRAQAGEPACWWVLDFKSSLAPQEQLALRRQMQDYQQAVQALYPEALVRAAFLTQDGQIRELD